MISISKQSVKIELNPEDFDDQRHLLEETIFTAISMLANNEGEEDLILLNRFFTMRFDETDSNTIAATITASEKRGN